MSKKKTHKEWFERLIQNNKGYTYPNFFDNPLTKSSRSKIEIKCPDHGIWSTSIISNHLTGKANCPKCSNHIPLTHEELLRRFFIVHGNLYNYPNFLQNDINRGIRTVIEIECKEHGIFNQSIDSHINNKSKCRRCTGNEKLTHNDFIDRLKSSNKYYVNSNFKILGKFTKLKDKILVEDEFGKCLISAGLLLRNSKPSIKSAINKNHYIIKRFQKIHGNGNNYSEVDYKGDKVKVKITCKQGHIFYMRPNDHTQGYSCPTCSINKVSKRMKENPVGWNYSYWQKRGNESKNFDSFKVYIIKCWNDDEEFYKIGKTFVTLDERFVTEKPTKRFPYYHKIVHITASLYDGKFISEEEKRLQVLNKNYKYTPKLRFDGMYECFSSIKGLDLY